MGVDWKCSGIDQDECPGIDWKCLGIDQECLGGTNNMPFSVFVGLGTIGSCSGLFRRCLELFGRCSGIAKISFWQCQFFFQIQDTHDVDVDPHLK